jgi:lipid II:glycine glycyltransferase (peptidoglycan interpeptide bridge formation enzyme)
MTSFELITISNSDECIGGLVLYWTQQVCHIQYMGTNSLGREKNAIDAIVDKVILMAIDRGIYLIDFGHSNENFGQNLNSGLYNFKSKFGGGGVGLLEFTIELG